MICGCTSRGEAYLNIHLRDNLVLTIGKKRLLSGGGFAYNPVDFIDAPPSSFHPDLKQGVYNCDLTYVHPAFALDTVLVIADQPEKCGCGLKLSTFSLLVQTDLNFIGDYARFSGLIIFISLFLLTSLPFLLSTSSVDTGTTKSSTATVTHTPQNK